MEARESNQKRVFLSVTKLKKKKNCMQILEIYGKNI